MRWLAMAVSFLIAGEAAAVRFGFTLRAPNGAAVDDAEICVFAAGPTPLGQWFGSEEIDCFPATTVVAFPPGSWNVFAVADGRYSSAHPYVLRIDHDPRATDSGYREILIDIFPAAELTFEKTIEAGQRAVIYFPGTSHSLAFAIPARSATVTIPAELPFVPAVIASDGTTRFGDLHRGAVAGQAVEVDDLSRGPSTDAVAYLRLAPLPNDMPKKIAAELPPPRIELVSGGRTYAAVVPNGPVRDGDLVIVKNVGGVDPAATLKLRGPTWEDAEAAVSVSGGVRNAPPLRLAPAAELRVTATTPVLEWLRGLTDDECSGPKVRPNALELWSAGGGEPRTGDLPALSSRGTTAFASLPAGAYELRLHTTRMLEPWRRALTLLPGSHDVTIELPLLSVSGEVTRAGAPVRARVSIGAGTAASTAGGAYTVYFPKETDRVLVRDCDTGMEFLHLPEQPLATLEQLDIELPAPATVRVVDRATSRPIENALVEILIRDVVKEPVGRTETNGRLTLTRTPLASFTVCASARDYAQRCTPGDSGGPVTIQLERVEAVAGAVEGIAQVRSGMLFFMGGDGSFREAVPVDVDGAFKHRLQHGPDVRAVFVSVSHPLAVLSLPPFGPLRLRFPPQPAREIVVRTPADAEYEIGLAIGGFVVPFGAFSRHQAFRGRSPFTSNGELVIAAVVESAPIVVYRGFPRTGRPPQVPPNADLFAQPELRAQFPSAAAGNGPVIFR